MQDNNETTRLVGVKEMAKILSVKPNTLYGWTYKGLPHTKISRCVRFDPQKVLNFFAEGGFKQKA